LKEQKIIRKLGIWLDHHQANLIEYIPEDQTDTNNITTVELNAEGGNSQNENVVHNKQQQDQGKFYKKLSDIIVAFDEVLLFGPTDAKLELLNILKADHHFDLINMETKQSDKMTENQQQAFVKVHFSVD
jgi:hypothetical protein